MVQNIETSTSTLYSLTIMILQQHDQWNNPLMRVYLVMEGGGVGGWMGGGWWGDGEGERSDVGNLWMLGVEGDWESKAFNNHSHDNSTPTHN